MGGADKEGSPRGRKQLRAPHYWGLGTLHPRANEQRLVHGVLAVQTMIRTRLEQAEAAQKDGRLFNSFACAKALEVIWSCGCDVYAQQRHMLVFLRLKWRN
jgi:hypothetical protein